MNSLEGRHADEKPAGLQVSATSMVLLAGLCFCCLLAWVFAYVWTAPEGIVWHASHGNYAWFDGRKVAIPWDMWAEESGDQQLTIMREAPSNPILHSPSAIILIDRNKTLAPLDMSKAYDRLDRVNEQTSGDFHFQSVHKIAASKGMGYCWEARTYDAAYISISCWFDKDTLGASYVGSSIYRDKFYKIVATVSDAGLSRQ